MKTTIRNGFSACMGLCDTGWYGGALVIDGRDKEFQPVPKDLSYDQRAAHARRWAEMTINPHREIRLVLPNEDGMTSRCVAAAERLEGPVAPPEPVATPTLAWIERRNGQWHLVVFENKDVRTVLSRNHVLRNPQIAKTADGLIFAFEIDTGPAATAVEVVNQHGTTLQQVAGREPVLRAAGEGLALCCEQATPNTVTLRLDFFANAKQPARSTGSDRHDFQAFNHSAPAKPEQTVTLSEGDYLLNADMAWSGENQTLSIVAESSPRWGYSNQIGLHRTIPVWQWQPGHEAVSLGMLPVEQRAFGSIGKENITPIKPFVLIEDGRPVVGFKQHRYTGFRGFGWDLFWCRRSEEKESAGFPQSSADDWTAPVRISPSPTRSDTRFGLIRHDGHYIGLFPAHENEGGNGAKQSESSRVDLVTFSTNTHLDRFDIPADKQVEYRLPPTCKNVAPEPVPLANPYEDRHLIWGDLHIHSIYSKCVSAVDGCPRENIRFAREVLGCRVFAFAEHTPHTTGIESTWLYDQLESSAGKDNVILYATEPGIKGTRHMNLYSRNRETFEKLERILIAQKKCYQETLRQMREDLPRNSVFVMRHVHGDAIPDEQIPQHFDPHFEVAMEAMQGRGNAMLGEFEGCSKFPNSFLDASCKVGLVGGTDHFREWAPNHFCLTGFWVKEVSPDGVWEAIRNRYTIAMSDSRVAMLTRCKGAPMGETVTLAPDEPMRVSVQASCGHRIRRITLMRGGALLPWTEVNATSANLELVDKTPAPGYHWYVVTAEVDTGHGPDNTGICHASPYFVWKAAE